MAKEEKKDTVPGTIGVVIGNSGGGVKPSIPLTIESELEAYDFVKQRYQVPKGDKVVFVTSDCSVFYQAEENSARSHQAKQNLKLFEIKWQD
jgi:hypothetical protein